MVLRALAAILSQVQADREAHGAGYVHGLAAGEVKPAKGEGPAVGVPDPVGGGFVHDGESDED